MRREFVLPDYVDNYTGYVREGQTLQNEQVLVDCVAVFCVLYVVCCLLSVACCLLSVVCCLFYCVCCVLIVVLCVCICLLHTLISPQPLNNERICVPEVLFNPSDIGIQQGGLIDAILQSVNSTHPDLHEGTSKL